MEGNKKTREKIRNRIKFKFLIVDPNYFIQCRLINNTNFGQITGIQEKLDTTCT